MKDPLDIVVYLSDTVKKLGHEKSVNMKVSGDYLNVTVTMKMIPENLRPVKGTTEAKRFGVVPLSEQEQLKLSIDSKTIGPLHVVENTMGKVMERLTPVPITYSQTGPNEIVASLAYDINKVDMSLLNVPSKCVDLDVETRKAVRSVLTNALPIPSGAYSYDGSCEEDSPDAAKIRVQKYQEVLQSTLANPDAAKVDFYPNQDGKFSVSVGFMEAPRFLKNLGKGVSKA